MIDLGTGILSKRPHTKSGAGRVYCYTDTRWIASSDDNYSTAYYQFAEPSGTGTDPITEWEHLGDLCITGERLIGLVIGGRCTSSELTDMEISIGVKLPASESSLLSGVDADGETNYTEIYRDLLFNPVTAGQPPWTGAGNDYHQREIALEHEFARNSMLSIYFKPVGTMTATRYWSTHWAFVFE